VIRMTHHDIFAPAGNHMKFFFEKRIYKRRMRKIKHPQQQNLKLYSTLYYEM
jgi:hypothetical protein